MLTAMTEQTESLPSRRRATVGATLILLDREPPDALVLRGVQRLGSAPENELPVLHGTVSRLHAELRLHDDGVWVRDLGSRNGTTINGVHIREARVPDGATLHFGNARARIVYRSEEAAAPRELGQYDRLVGVSESIRRTFSELEYCAYRDVSVLLQGESGTGKELAARAIHASSRRAAHHFVAVDCAAMLGRDLEIALFGATSACQKSGQPGCFEAAAGGTVFLKEIGELPLSIQPRLLHVLLSRRVLRLGESETRPVDFRLIVSSQRDLISLVNVSAFREDLYFQIAAQPVYIPALRQRPEDIPVLVQHFLADRPWPDGLTLDQLTGRPWMGNVRELKHVVERACEHYSTQSASLPERLEGPALLNETLATLPLREFRERWNEAGEELYLGRLLERAGNKVATAARLAGVDRTYIYRLIRKRR